MNRILFGLVGFVMSISPAMAQVANDADGLFDSTSYVATDSTTTNTTNSTVITDNTNTNNTTIDSTSTSTTNNTNVNDTTINSTNTNTNLNTNNTTINSTTTSTNTNNNTNTNNTTVNSTSNSTVNTTSNNTNNNTNVNTSTIDQNVNQNTNSTINQTVNSTSNITSNNTNNNTNVNTNTNNTTVNSTSNNNNVNQNNNVNDSTITQKVESPPPSAIAPTIMGGGNDTCTVTFSGAVQTQIFGVSGGGHIRDLNCERLKNAKTLYNMGMKVAAVSLMCQEPSVYKAMEMAGTPCPFRGQIGDAAQALWDENPQMQPETIERETRRNDKVQGMAIGSLLMLALLAL